MGGQRSGVILRVEARLKTPHTPLEFAKETVSCPGWSDHRPSARPRSQWVCSRPLPMPASQRHLFRQQQPVLLWEALALLLWLWLRRLAHQGIRPLDQISWGTQCDPDGQ